MTKPVTAQGATRSRTVQYRLEWPVELRGKIIEEVTIRRPKAADNMRLPKKQDAGVAEMHGYFAALLTLPDGSVAGMEFVDELDVLDFRMISEIINSFTMPAETAGQIQQPR
jgi:hypothetical protein